MPLRPRYSLLTLLLLMAAVAGGIKYWRGPHWQILTPVNTDEDAQLLSNMGCSHPLIWEVSAQQLELTYVNQLHGRVYLTLKGRPQATVCYVTSRYGGAPVLLKAESPANELYEADADRVLCWLCRLPSSEVTQQIEEKYAGNVCGASAYAQAKASSFYLLTANGRLYTTDGWTLGFPTDCELIETAAISDPLVRDWISNEMPSRDMMKK